MNRRPEPTEHWAPVTGFGSVTVMSTLSISLFHAGAITFQKNTVGVSISPVASANCFPAPAVPQFLPCRRTLRRGLSLMRSRAPDGVRDAGEVRQGTRFAE